MGIITSLLIVSELQPGHLVGVSGNVIWVTSQGPGCEYVQQLEMFVILKYNTWWNWSWRPECLSLLLGNWRWHGKQFVSKYSSCAWVQMLPPNMKRIRSLSTELWYILFVHIICPCDLDLWTIYTNSDQYPMMKIFAYFEVYTCRPLPF